MIHNTQIKQQPHWTNTWLKLTTYTNCIHSKMEFETASNLACKGDWSPSSSFNANISSYRLRKSVALQRIFNFIWCLFIVLDPRLHIFRFCSCGRILSFRLEQGASRWLLRSNSAFITIDLGRPRRIANIFEGVGRRGNSSTFVPSKLRRYWTCGWYLRIGMQRFE